jgi:hypothetical protein
MTGDGLREIVVQAADGEQPEAVARRWTRQLELLDGVRIAVQWGATATRPRRFVVHDGDVVSPQRYAAVSIGDALEELLRAEGRPLDAWEILVAARRRGSPVAAMPMATIAGSARLLAREGRLRRGPTPDTWVATRQKEEAA